MWHYIEIYTIHPGTGEHRVTGACFIEPFLGGERVAVLHAEMRGWVNAWERTRVIPLPRLKGQIPEQFLDVYLSVDRLCELDVYMGGDGSGTIPASERKLPWAP